jgi:hypothetical protein
LNEPHTGKYRSERKGLLSALFFCDPDQSTGLLLVEGEIKAMVFISH